MNQEEIKEVVMDWFYTFQRRGKVDLTKFIYFCKHSFSQKSVSMKKYETILDRYSEWNKDWENCVKNTYLTYSLNSNGER